MSRVVPLRALCALLAALALLGGAAVTDARTPLATFPPVTGDNLSGERFDLPGDFAGEWNLVLLAFEQRQQPQVDTWLERAPEWLARFPGLRVYELPTLARGYGLVRGFIDGGMRSGIPDPEARARTITLYIDRSAFLETLGLDGFDTIHALLVRPDGAVLWRAEGPYREAAGRELAALLDAP